MNTAGPVPVSCIPSPARKLCGGTIRCLGSCFGRPPGFCDTPFGHGALRFAKARAFPSLVCGPNRFFGISIEEFIVKYLGGARGLPYPHASGASAHGAKPTARHSGNSRGIALPLCFRRVLGRVCALLWEHGAVCVRVRGSQAHGRPSCG